MDHGVVNIKLLSLNEKEIIENTNLIFFEIF